MGQKQPSRSGDGMADLPPIERHKISIAYAKLLRSEKLSREEQAGLNRFEKEREERLRWQYYHSIPKKHWRQMSGRQAKVINEQAARHDLPLGGPKIDLPEFVRAFHDFLAKHAQKLTQEDDSLLPSAQGSPALERYREERAKLAKLDRLERERKLLPRLEVRRNLTIIARIIRGAGERLTKRFGNEASAILNDALDDAEWTINHSFGEEETERDDW